MESTDTTRADGSKGLGPVPVDAARAVLTRTVNLLRTLRFRCTGETAVGLFVAIAFVTIVRLFEMKMPINPDGFHKWDIARDLLAGQNMRPSHFDHHAARWAINVPLMVSQALFGTSAVVAYVPILLFNVLQGVFTYLIGVALGSRALGLCAVVLFTLVPKMNYVGSELLPTIFESAYALGACYCAVQAGARGRTGWLAASLAFAFAAYLAKETTVFFLPGMLLGVLLVRRNVKELLAYAAGFVALFALETLLYRLLLGLKLGRVTIISGHHLNNARLQRPIRSFSEFFDRYTDLSGGFFELFFFALLVTVTYPFWRRWLGSGATATPQTSSKEGSAAADDSRAVNDALRLGPYLIVVLSCWSFFFFSTFAVKSLHPPQLAQPPNERYLFSALPFLALVVAGFFSLLGRRLLEPLPKRWLTVAGAALIVGSGVWSLVVRGRAWAKNPLVLTPQYEQTLRDAFDTGIPIVARRGSENALSGASRVFLDRDRSKNLRCVQTKGKGAARVCVNRQAPMYKGLKHDALRAKLSRWSKKAYVEVATKRGFSAILHDSSRSS